eukprot:534376_1
MATLVTMKPLKLKGTLISYPFINQNVPNDCIDELLVRIEHKTNEETPTLRYTLAEYHPNYLLYLRKCGKTPLYDQIVDYMDKFVEEPIEYEHRLGQYGYLTNTETLEHSFGFISKKSEYESELFYLQDELQKYEFTHCDITSKTFRLLPEDEIEGKSVGWITGSIFNPIDGIILPDITKTEQALNWKICREDYLLKKMELNEIKLMSVADSRGVLFRQTAIQCIAPAVKSMRGKINTLNVGKTIEIGFILPTNCWNYYYKPTIEIIFDIQEDEELNREGNWFNIEFDMDEFNEISGTIHLIKFYDQNAVAFKLNKSIECKIEQGDDMESIHETLKNNLNKYSLKRYKKLKQKEENKLMQLKRTKYLLTINGLKWKYNRNSGKSYFTANCYKKTFLDDGTIRVTGKIMD